MLHKCIWWCQDLSLYPQILFPTNSCCSHHRLCKLDVSRGAALPLLPPLFSLPTSSNQSWLPLHLRAATTLPQSLRWKRWMWTWNPYFPSSFPYRFLSHSCCGDKKESIRSHAVQNHAVKSRGWLLAAARPGCYHWIIPPEKRQWHSHHVILWHCWWSVYSIAAHKLSEIVGAQCNSHLRDKICDCKLEQWNLVKLSLDLAPEETHVWGWHDLGWYAWAQ